MAKPKQAHLVEECETGITVWTNDPEGDFKEIKRIEGVSNAIMSGDNPICVYVDPRYSLADIAEEIRQLLKAEIPDVFREK